MQKTGFIHVSEKQRGRERQRARINRRGATEEDRQRERIREGVLAKSTGERKEPEHKKTDRIVVTF